MSPSDFWESTPREVFEFVKAAAKRERKAKRRALLQAYYAGVIARSSEKIPKFEELFPDPDAEVPDVPSTPEQHLQFWETLAANVNAAEAARIAAGLGPTEM